MPKKSYRQAINEALSQEMERDHRVVVMGEDVAGGLGAPGEDDAWGGPLGVTKGLMAKFGRERVLDTPISESSFIGAAVGAAATGLRPGGRADVRRLHGGLLRPDLQPGRQVQVHVRRQGGDPGGDPHHVRRRLPRRLAAQPVPLPAVHPHPRPEGGAAQQRLRGQGPPDPVDPRRRPGDLLRAQGDVRRGGRRPGRGLRHPVRPGQRHPRGRRRHHRRVRPDGELRQRGRRQAEQGRDLLHGGRPAHHLAARHRDDPGDGRGDRPGGDRRRGAPPLQHGDRHLGPGDLEPVGQAQGRRRSW